MKYREVARKLAALGCQERLNDTPSMEFRTALPEAPTVALLGSRRRSAS